MPIDRQVHVYLAECAATASDGTIRQRGRIEAEDFASAEDLASTVEVCVATLQHAYASDALSAESLQELLSVLQFAARWADSRADLPWV